MASWTLPIQQAYTPQSPELHWLRRHTHYVLDSARVALTGAVTLSFGIAVNLVLLAVALGATAWFLAWTYLASGTIELPKSEFSSLDDKGSGIGLDVGGHWWVLQHVHWVLLAGRRLPGRARLGPLPHGSASRTQDPAVWVHVVGHRRNLAIAALRSAASRGHHLVRLRRFQWLDVCEADLFTRDRASGALRDRDQSPRSVGRLR